MSSRKLTGIWVTGAATLALVGSAAGPVASAAPGCNERGWSAAASMPRGSASTARPAYSLWHDSSGWHLRLRSTASAAAAGRLSADRTVRILSTSAGVRTSRERSGRSFTFRLAGTGKTGGIHFTASCARHLAARFGSARVQLGARQAPAQSFTVSRPPTTGVAGRIIVGPTCAVVTPSCPPARGASGTVRIDKAPGAKGPSGQVFSESVTSSATGGFSAALAPGDYLLSVEGTSGTSRTAQVHVESGVVSEVTLVLDTGIR